MTVFNWTELNKLDRPSGPVNATIGVFDGLHRGHRTLIEQLHRQDNPAFADAKPLVVTFRTSPKKVLQRAYPGDLMTWELKLSTLKGLGVQTVVAIDFSEEFSKMSGRDFFLSLKKSFVFSKLVLGWNFSFGKGSGTSASDLGWLADPQTRLTVVPPFVAENEIVSSSRIRTALLNGDVFLANQLLGREYVLALTEVSSSDGGVVCLGFSQAETLVPGPGRYLCRFGERTGLLHVKDETLTWESPPGERLKHIVFVQGVQNGIE